jgi:hypothetical protein
MLDLETNGHLLVDVSRANELHLIGTESRTDAILDGNDQELLRIGAGSKAQPGSLQPPVEYRLAPERRT